MINQRNVILLAAGAVVMVVAVFAALRFAGGLSGSDVPAAAMSRADVEKIVHQYLINNPDVIFEAVKEKQRREDENRYTQMRQTAKSHTKQLFAEPEPIVAGNPKGDITIVEFFDYRCPYCKSVKQTVSDLLKQDGNIKLILKEFPILSPESEMAARAAVASLQQNKYWDFHMAMMGAEDLSEDAIYNIAKGVGINVEKLKTDMKDPRVQKRLIETQELARTLGIDATPTFFIGDEPTSGAKTLEELKELVAAARKARPS
jgi:protein-disulfide isomerase